MIAIIEKRRGVDPEWYNEILLKAEIYDDRYPVKGCGVWLDYGLKIMNKIFSELEKMLDEDGHKKLLLPMLIPEDIFGKESEHIKGFEGEVFWITHGGVEKLEKRLVLRPTSETILYYMFKLWIRNYKDLPLKVYQTAEVFRYETKATRPLLRVREIYWNEAHCVHVTHEESFEQVMKALKMYEKLFRETCCLENILIVERPEWDKFAGAETTFAIDCYIELTGRTLQIGTSHDLGQNFTKAFNVVFRDKDGSEKYPYSNSYGISCRVLGAIILTHSDNIGLILPPKIAPIKVVIVPIPYKGKENEIINYAKEIYEIVKNEIPETIIDLSEERPGWKYYFWEMKGVPIRIEVGPKDLENGSVTLVRRDTREKIVVKREDIVNKIKEVLDEIQENLRKRSKEILKNAIVKVNNLEELEKVISEKKIALAPFCSLNKDGENCAKILKEKFAVEVLGKDINSKEIPINEKCIVCGKPAKFYVYIAKKY